MIPKIIHYCWFGRNPLPELALRCIDSWRKFFPDYEIVEWNEDNFDVNMTLYTQQAYSVKKYAFVSDYARFWILYHYGGLYFDTDVEVIKPMDDILANGSFMGIEVESSNATPYVNPGLGLAANPSHSFYKQMLDYYEVIPFLNIDGKHSEITIVSHTTNVLITNGLQPSNAIQQVAGIWIYPQDYFNPLDSLTGKLKITHNTRSIHWFMNSWSNHSKLYGYLSKISHRLFGLTLHRIKCKILRMLRYH